LRRNRGSSFWPSGCSFVIVRAVYHGSRAMALWGRVAFLERPERLVLQEAQR